MLPLAMPPDLLGEVRETAAATGLSLATTMRQIIATILRTHGWV